MGVCAQEQALAARGELMGEVLEKGSMEVGPLKRQTPKGEPVELLEATLWAVEAPTGTHSAHTACQTDQA